MVERVVPTADRMMIDVLDIAPKVGQDVLALTPGGVTVRVTWQSNSHRFYDAWEPHARVPASVKARQLSRFGVSE